MLGINVYVLKLINTLDINVYVVKLIHMTGTSILLYMLDIYGLW